MIVYLLFIENGSCKNIYGTRAKGENKEENLSNKKEWFDEKSE
jgi:hypothetical protein